MNLNNQKPQERTTFVLDTSVLLSVPRSLEDFGNNDVVLPIVVLTELESKRSHPELGWAARTALRKLEQIRLKYGGLTDEFPVNKSGGTVRVELNHGSEDLVPDSLKGETGNDHRILLVAVNLQAEGKKVVLVSKDLPLRLRAGVLGVPAEEYFLDIDDDPDWSGISKVKVEDELVDKLYENNITKLEGLDKNPINTGLILEASGGSALGKIIEKPVEGEAVVELIHEKQAFGIKGRNAEQRIALDFLLDPRIDILSIGGPAGTGKSVLALAAGLEAVLEAKTHDKIMIFRPLFSVGGQDLGFLPGTEEEKMRPWTDAVKDALAAITNASAIEEINRLGIIEVLPLTYIRGRTLNDAFVVIDEAQNLERSVLLTALSRLGVGSKVVLTHDVAQRDNLRVGRRDGVSSVVASLKGHDIFAHVSLTKTERSRIAALVSSTLDSES